MKGLLYKDQIILRKQLILSALFFLMASIIMVLIRVSMDVGNLSHDEEVRSSLLRNMWVIRYIPPIILALSVSLNAGMIVMADSVSGWTRFCKTTALGTRRFVAEKFTLVILESISAFILGFVYLLIVCTASGENITLRMTGRLAAICFAAMILSVVDLSASFVFRSNQKKSMFMIILFTVFTMVITPVMISILDKYDGQTDIDLFDILRKETEWFMPYLLPVLAGVCVILLAAGFILSERFLERSVE